MNATGQLARIVGTFRERLLSGFSWNVLATASMQGSVLVSTIIVARLLSLQAFGSYSLLVATVMTVAGIAQGGCGLVATKFVAEHLGAEPERVGRVLKAGRLFALVMGGVAAGIVFAGANLLSVDVLGRPELVQPIRWVALATAFHVSVSYQTGVLQGFGAFREMSRAGALAGLGQIAFTAIGAWLGQLSGALLGFVAASAFRATVFGLALRRLKVAHRIPDQVSVDATEFGVLWRFALPAGLAGFVTMPCLWFVTVMVARLPDGLGLVAMFSVAHQLRLAVLQMPSLLNAVSFSVLSRLKGLNESVGYRSVFWSNIVMNGCFSALAITLLVLLAKPLLRLYGPDFSNGQWILILLLLSVLPEMLAMSFYQLVQSAGRMWYSLFLIAIPRDLLYLALAMMLVPIHGVIGAAAAYLIAHGAGMAFTFAAARRHAPASIWQRHPA